MRITNVAEIVLFTDTPRNTEYWINFKIHTHTDQRQKLQLLLCCIYISEVLVFYILF